MARSQKLGNFCFSSKKKPPPIKTNKEKIYRVKFLTLFYLLIKNKKTYKKNLTIVVLLLYGLTQTKAQTILNGSFENNSSSLSCNYNMNNAVFPVLQQSEDRRTSSTYSLEPIYLILMLHRPQNRQQ